MALDTFLSEFFGHSEGFPLELAGPMARLLLNQLEDPLRTRATIATIMWQSIVHSPLFPQGLERAGIPERDVFRAQPIVVSPDSRSFYLLVLHPAARPTTRFEIEPTATGLSWGWSNFANFLEARPLYSDIGGAIAIEALQRAPVCRGVICPTPPVVPVNAPPAAWEVHAMRSSHVSSTAGVVVTDKKKRSGVTAALHGVGSNTTVTVNGISGTVRRRSKISDSCFIEVGTQGAGSKGAKGPLVNMLPRGNQAADYEGFTTANTTKIIAWDYAAPNVSRHSQIKVYTPQIAQPGDSGAALISDDDYVVGFALESTGRNVQPDYTSWVWAHSVYKFLKLEY